MTVLAPQVRAAIDRLTPQEHQAMHADWQAYWESTNQPWVLPPPSLTWMAKWLVRNGHL